MKVFSILSGIITILLMISTPATTLPVEDCMDICPLAFKLNCSSNGTCMKAFSNYCDLLFYNCRYEQNFKRIEPELCTANEALLCDEIDRQVVAAFS